MASYRTNQEIAATVAYATSLEKNPTGLEVPYYAIYDAVLRQLLKFKPKNNGRFKQVIILRPGVLWMEKTRDMWQSNLVQTLDTIGLTIEDLPFETKPDKDEIQTLADMVQERQRNAKAEEDNLASAGEDDVAGNKTTAPKNGNESGRTLRPRDGMKQPSRGPELAVKTPFTAERIKEVIRSAIAIRNMLDDMKDNRTVDVEKYLFPDFMVLLVVSVLVKSKENADEAQLARDRLSANCEILSYVPILIGEIKRHPGVQNGQLDDAFQEDVLTFDAALQQAGYTASALRMFPHVQDVALFTGIGTKYAINSICRTDIPYLLNGNLTFSKKGRVDLKKEDSVHWCNLVLGSKLHELCSADSHRIFNEFRTDHLVPAINQPITVPDDVKQRIITVKEYQQVLSGPNYTNKHIDIQHPEEEVRDDAAPSTSEDVNDPAFEPPSSVIDSEHDDDDTDDDDDSDYNPELDG